jgi:metal-responsive CopG/Arc/MetJ family transcriptional regulator
MRAEPKDQRVPIMMSKSMKERIDAWRRPLGIDDRSEAIRLMIEEKLQAERVLADA